jgi:hypothetical protein
MPRKGVIVRAVVVTFTVKAAGPDALTSTGVAVAAQVAAENTRTMFHRHAVD